MKRKRIIKPLKKTEKHALSITVYLHVGVVLYREVEDLAWIVIKTLDDVIQSKTAIADGGQQQRQHGLQAGVTRRRARAALLLNRVGR